MKKMHPQLPERLTNIIQCKNPPLHHLCGAGNPPYLQADKQGKGRISLHLLRIQGKKVNLSRNQDFDLFKQKNKQMHSGGGKHLETPCFPRGGKACFAHATYDSIFSRPQNSLIEIIVRMDICEGYRFFRSSGCLPFSTELSQALLCLSATRGKFIHRHRRLSCGFFLFSARLCLQFFHWHPRLYWKLNTHPHPDPDRLYIRRL